jgi:hypothetical protein
MFSFIFMRAKILLLLFIPSLLQAQDMTTVFERTGGKESATYAEAISYCKMLARRFPTITMEEAGPTDAYYPLHVVYYSKDGNFDPVKWRKRNKVILLINNDIHPGEPDGVDASLMLLRDAVTGKIDVPENVVLAVIPVYNIGGALNRGRPSRANQNGPEAYGFRGSAQNLDLNRDFIKMDAKETRTLVELFHYLDPDMFIDNHVSDGADYQHVMTLLETQHNKLGGALGKYQHKTVIPLVYKDMKERGYDLVPYVNDFDDTPDKGWREFLDYPRFSSGFAALFQTMAFVPETHMWKPYEQRVESTYALMLSFIKIASGHADEIHAARSRDREQMLSQKTFAIDWKVDTTRHSNIMFKGYEAVHKLSKVSGLPRLYYDRSKPFTKQVPVYDHFMASKKVTAPEAYVIQRGWTHAINRLKWNGVEMEELKEDTLMKLTVYRIDKYDTLPHPYEGHYMHHNVAVHTGKEKVQLHKGDYIIPLDQLAKRYLVEVLEPLAPDALFAWNFFDAILQQKEYYSAYIFEDQAAELLRKDAKLRKLFEEKKKNDKAFAKDGKAQLDFIYHHSVYMEPEYMRYPVFRID